MEEEYKETGKITYYFQMLGGSRYYRDFKEDIPLYPEMIFKQECIPGRSLRVQSNTHGKTQ